MKLTLIPNPVVQRLETAIQEARDQVLAEVADQMNTKADNITVEQLTTQVMATMGIASAALRRNNT